MGCLLKDYEVALSIIIFPRFTNTTNILITDYTTSGKKSLVVLGLELIRIYPNYTAGTNPLSIVGSIPNIAISSFIFTLSSSLISSILASPLPGSITKLIVPVF